MSEKAKRVLLLGTRPYSEVIFDLFEGLAGIEFSGSVENMDRTRCKETLFGLPIYWSDDIDHMKDSHQLVAAIATTKRKDWIESCEAKGFEFAKLIHPSNVVSKRTDVGSGSIIDAGCVVAGYSEIGNHCRIGRRSSIGHHTNIGQYTTVHPGAVISGNCRIGKQVFIGTGAVIVDGVEIGNGAVIAAGSVVFKNIPVQALVFGNPATIKRQNYGPK
jgi:sugar O-acyltransferase (sialic acid O-acetyltransferase NeuD family)